MPRPFDNTPLTDAQREAAALLLPLARCRAAWFAGQWKSLTSEVYSAAQFGAVLAARDDRGHGASPKTYARNRIDTAIRNAIAERPFAMASLRRFDPIDPTNHVAEIDARDEVEVILARLSANLAEALRLVYLEGLTQAEAARRLGRSQTAISTAPDQARIVLIREANACHL